MRSIVALSVLLGVAEVARADDEVHPIIVSAKLGGIAPLDGLSPNVSGGIEVGYTLPLFHRRFAVVLDVDYAQPTKTGTEMDPRVAGGTYAWKLTEQELGVMPVLMYRATYAKGWLVPYGGIGPRLMLFKSTVKGGAPVIDDTTEVSTKIGFGIPLGAELHIGPGRLIGELLFQYGTLDHTATGDSHSGAISLSVGYRMMF